MRSECLTASTEQAAEERGPGQRALYEESGLFRTKWIFFYSDQSLFYPSIFFPSRPTAFLPPRERKAPASGCAAVAVPSRAGREQGPSEE